MQRVLLYESAQSNPVLSISIVYLMLAFPNSSTHDAPEVWRAPRFDAANCLYVLLKYHGADVTRAAIESRIPTDNVSLLDLQRICSIYGYNAKIRRSAAGDTLHSSLPAITLLNDPEHGESFALAFNREDQDRVVYFLSGGYAITQRLPFDEFQRVWVPVVLEIDANGTSSFTVLHGSVVGFVVSLIVRTMIRLRRITNSESVR